ncbi:MAG: ShlB/FhaC/HecB family hemolysin secretion/activation protein, partial [Merismopedia sp. SIO2A8]|nr:ShlB/FhaC/HecB family hemolysin secretion/activation protein [Merismopedia sp. SIO2A8]
RASLSQGNFLGWGDRLILGANQTEGSDGWNISYAIPINRRNGTFSFAYSNSSSEVIEEPFGVLDIQSESRSYEFTLRQPVIQTPTEELALSLTASRRETESEFLASLTGTAEPFPSTGADADGQTRISALRFAQDWTRQTPGQVFALRSELSFGLDALNSTINPIRPDSRFFSWRGQGQWVRQIGSDSLFLLRGDIQLADGPLVPGEQFGLGGQSTIRGYRQDSLLTDNGWLASAEFRVPILQVPKVDGVLQIAPFIDIGQGWNPKEPDPLDSTLASTGLGLLWRMGDRFSARLDWGIPLTVETSSGSSLQEDGFHFSLQFSPF